MVDPATMAMIGSQVAGVAGGLIGGGKESRERSRMKAARRKALKRQRELWKTGYAKSEGEFEGARRGIRERELAGLSAMQGQMAQRGLGNTTAATNLARGVRSDTSRALTDLASAQAARRYQQYQDRIGLQGTVYDQPMHQFQTPAYGASYGMAGAELGSALGGLADLFGQKKATPELSPYQQNALTAAVRSYRL